MSTTYTISDLAKEFDLTTRAIRFYEDMGLLEPERAGPGGRNRVYSARDRTRLRLTLRAKRLGLSLNEAKEIIDLYDSPVTRACNCANSWRCWLCTAASSKTAWPICRPTWPRCESRNPRPALC